MTGARPRPRLGSGSEDGTILVLTLGYLMVSLMLIIVVVDVTAVYLARRGLSATADGAALAAAQQVDQNAVYGGTGTLPALPLGNVQQEVARYGEQADPSGNTVLTAGLTNPTTVHVAGTRRVRLPLVGFLGITEVTVHAGADARSLVVAPGP